jgi:hypothetical protein
MRATAAPWQALLRLPGQSSSGIRNTLLLLPPQAHPKLAQELLSLVIRGPDSPDVAPRRFLAKINGTMKTI